MSNNTATKASLEEKYNDYEKTPVPETARQTWYQQGMVWLGAGFGLSGLATGGVLADGLSFRDMLLVSIIGSIIITIIGTLNALVSEHTHPFYFFYLPPLLWYKGCQDHRHYSLHLQLWLVRISGRPVRYNDCFCHQAR